MASRRKPTPRRITQVLRVVAPPRASHLSSRPQPHSSTSGPVQPQRLEEKVARFVAAPDLVLDVERAVGGGGKHDACGERLPGLWKRVDPRLARIIGCVRRDGAAEPSVAGTDER